MTHLPREMRDKGNEKDRRTQDRFRPSKSEPLCSCIPHMRVLIASTASINSIMAKAKFYSSTCSQKPCWAASLREIDVLKMRKD